MPQVARWPDHGVMLCTMRQSAGGPRLSLVYVGKENTRRMQTAECATLNLNSVGPKLHLHRPFLCKWIGDTCDVQL